MLAASLGREVVDYIKNFLNKDALVLDEKNQCIACIDQNFLGREIKLADSDKELTSPKEITISDQKKILIPLRHQNENVASLLIDHQGEEMQKYLPLIKSFSELLIQQYYENNKPQLDSTDHFISNILNNFSPANTAEYEMEAKMLGYDISSSRMAICVHLEGFWDNCLLDFDQPSFERDEIIKNWKRNIEQSFNSFFTKNADLIVAYIGSDKFVIYKAVDNNGEDATKKLLKRSYKSIFEPLKSHRIKSVTVGYGNAYSGILGLISSQREAELSLELGQRMSGRNSSYYFGDLGLLSIIGDGDRDKKIDFADRLLSKLRNNDLRKTIECFFENNLNLTETADKMKIHRNTVIYRLNQIAKTLDADPRIFEQAMSIKIALIIKSLFN